MSFFADAIQRGTRAAQPAATTVVVGTLYYVTDESKIERSNGTTWDAYSGSGGGSGTVTTTGSPASGQSVQFSGATSITSVAAPAICEGRLTTESGVPVSTSDRTAQGTIYWSPCLPSGRSKTNGQIALYDGTTVVLKSVTQLSKALTITSGKNKNVYIDYNAGTPQIVLGADWTSDVLESETLVDQNGILVLSGTPAYRYVGVIRASGANVVEDSQAKRFVWNAFNQVARSSANTVETTDSWTYSTATWRQARASSANQFEYVCGLAGTTLTATVVAMNSSGTAVSRAVGVGIDSTTVVSGFRGYFANTANGTGVATYQGSMLLGYHFVAWLEIGAGSGTQTWYGDAGTTDVQSGIHGTIWN